jgi:type IV pilus assembly protein PilM
MLSIEITDREVKILEATNIGKRVKILRSVSQSLPKDAVSNGYITNTEAVSTTLSQCAPLSGFNRKKAVISISSSHIIFKEMHIPKANNVDFNAMVLNQVYSVMSITGDYSINYNVIDHFTNEDGILMAKILVTACPQKLVDGYKRIAAKHGMILKGVYINSNIISNVLLADESLKAKMPLLLVQVNKSYLNISVYEESQMTFSRHVDINPSDYTVGSNYLSTAVSENVFRMLQFYNTKHKNPIQNIVLYGDLEDYDNIHQALKQWNLSIQVLPSPDYVAASDFNFSFYANAVGALISTFSLKDEVNLLNSIARTSGAKKNAFYFLLAGITIFSLVIVGGAFFLFKALESTVEAQTTMVYDRMRSEAITSQLAEIAAKEAKLDRINKYNTHVSNANEIYEALPKIHKEAFRNIELNMLSDMRISSFVYADSVLTVHFVAVEGTTPDAYVQRLHESGYFADIAYNGYTDNISLPESEYSVTFSVSVLLKGGDVNE